MTSIDMTPLASVVVQTIGGGTPQRDVSEFWNGGIPWATVKDFKDGILRLRGTQEEISERGLKFSASHLIPSGNPIICMRMAVGRVAIADKPVAINQDLRALVVKDTYDVDYVLYAIDALRRDIENISIGSTVKGISVDRLVAFEIAKLPKTEQTKIAEVLSTVDRAIEQTEALIAKQQRIKTGLMQDLLTKGIDEHGNLRSEATHAFKDSPLGRIPVEWEVKAVGTMISNIDAGWSPSCPDETPAQGEWGVLKVSAVSSGVYQPSESKRLPPELTPIKAIEIKPGNVLLTRSNGIADLVGKCVLVERTPTKLMLSDKTLRLCPSMGQITPFVLFSSLSSHASRLQILASLNGSSGQKNISQSQIRAIRVAVPLVNEQERIQRVLNAQVIRISRNVAHLRKLRSIKIALMQGLLTGKKRVTPILETATTD